MVPGFIALGNLGKRVRETNDLDGEYRYDHAFSEELLECLQSDEQPDLFVATIEGS
ncbi:MAG: hypothetical protein OXH31_10480 [Gammaproteobacteria bacterium]|nr:hypothetical protein [Gammaproteobacteria bacterium]